MAVNDDDDNDDTDGYKLLEYAGFELNNPSIMMTADDSARTVAEGMRHEGCHVLIKPLQYKYLPDIYAHVDGPRRLAARCQLEPPLPLYPLPPPQEKAHSSNKEDVIGSDLKGDNHHHDSSPTEPMFSIWIPELRRRSTWTRELRRRSIDAFRNVGNNYNVRMEIFERMKSVPRFPRVEAVLDFEPIDELLQITDRDNVKTGAGERLVILMC